MQELINMISNKETKNIKLAFKMLYNNAHYSEDIKHWDTEKLRREFLVEKTFSNRDINLTYTYNDRMIIGGVTPLTEGREISLSSEIGVDYF